jgi:aminopeptidase N
MRRVIPILLCVLMFGAAGAQQNSYDWNNLTQDDIEQIRAERHAFYAAESRGRQEAIVDGILEEAMKLDGNQADYDVRYYGIHLNLNFTSQSIIGQVDYRIKSVVNGLDAVDLNLRNELYVDSVIVEGQTAAFSHSNHMLMITTPGSYSQNDEFAMSVYYHGYPYYDGSAGMSFEPLLGAYPACWTKATPYRARYWWPCKDYPIDKADSLDLYIEMPDSYDLATNGLQVSSTPAGSGRKVVHSKHNYPINTYNVAFCCTEYNIDVQTWNYDSYSMPLYTYANPSNPGAYNAFRTFGPQTLTTFSDMYGVYPFVNEKMGNADFGWYGAMEHQTCCMYSPDFHDDWIIAHETSHQWFGDMITCRTFNHIWLNEGFASYSEALYFEQLLGQTAYFNYMQTQRYLGPGSIYVENLVYEEIYNSALSYDKASWVLHMLRGVVGDSVFFQILYDYANSEFKYGTATTEDFIAVASATAGEDLTWLIHEWIYGDGNPEYEYSWQCVHDTTRGGYDLSYAIEQVQEYGTYFKMPIRTTFQTTGDDLDTVLWNEGRFQLYEIWSADSVTDVVFDPQQWILRTATAAPFTLHIATISLPDAVLNQPYSQTLFAVGGLPPYHWRLYGGDLPFGMTFDTTTATLSGTPTWPATYFFTIQVQDSDDPPLTSSNSYKITVTEGPTYTCGDADGNDIVNIADAVALISYIFGSGPPPDPFEAGDVDCNSIVNISDAVYLINYIFGGGEVPCADCL